MLMKSKWVPVVAADKLPVAVVASRYAASDAWRPPRALPGCRAETTAEAKSIALSNVGTMPSI